MRSSVHRLPRIRYFLSAGVVSALLVASGTLSPWSVSWSAEDGDCRYYIEYTEFGKGPYSISADSPEKLAEMQRRWESWHRWAIRATGPIVNGEFTDAPWSLEWSRSYAVCGNTLVGNAKVSADNEVANVKRKLVEQLMPGLTSMLEALVAVADDSFLARIVGAGSEIASRPFAEYVGNLADVRVKIEELKRDLDFYSKLPDDFLSEDEFYDQLPIIRYEGYSTSQTIYDRQGRRLGPAAYVATYRDYVLHDERQLEQAVDMARDSFAAIPQRFREIMPPPISLDGGAEVAVSRPSPGSAPGASGEELPGSTAPRQDEGSGKVLVPVLPLPPEQSPESFPSAGSQGLSSNVAHVLDADIASLTVWAADVRKSGLDGGGWGKEHWDRYQTLARYALTYKTSMQSCFELLDPRFGGLDAGACGQGQAWARAGNMPWGLADQTYRDALGGRSVSGGQAAPHYMAAISAKSAAYALAFDIMLAEGASSREALGSLLDMALQSLSGFDAVARSEPGLAACLDIAKVVRAEVAKKRKQLP